MLSPGSSSGPPPMHYPSYLPQGVSGSSQQSSAIGGGASGASTAASIMQQVRGGGSFRPPHDVRVPSPMAGMAGPSGQHMNMVSRVFGL